jgi:hypothetical protein
MPAGTTLRLWRTFLPESKLFTGKTGHFGLVGPPRGPDFREFPPESEFFFHEENSSLTRFNRSVIMFLSNSHLSAPEKYSQN